MGDYEPSVVCEIVEISLQEVIVKNREWLPDLKAYSQMTQKQGCFVTLYQQENGKLQLRGCVGLPYPTHPLAQAIAMSTKKSATIDPRFNPIKEEELNSITYDVEILNPIEELRYSNLNDLEDQIEIGRDGLIIEYKKASGLLLPKVASRFNWNKIEYLQRLCQKALIPFETIESGQAKLSKFTSSYIKPEQKLPL